MKNNFVHYFHHFSACPLPVMKLMIREFLDQGVHHFVFEADLARRCANDPDFYNDIRQIIHDMGITFQAMHAPCGKFDDLNIPETENRARMIENHKKTMRIAAESGSQTYTIHVGAYHHCLEHIPLDILRRNAMDTLDQLLPCAEKLNIVIAVENSFEPPNSPQEVIALVERYDGNPHIGVCYDVGHANMMKPAPWKEDTAYPEYQYNNWKETGIVTEEHPFEILKEQIVTTHIHDNDGYRDLHGMPGDGVIDWNVMMNQLHSCPRMLEYQTEVCMFGGTNWAGKLLAPAGGYSVKRLVETFRNLGFK